MRLRGILSSSDDHTSSKDSSYEKKCLSFKSFYMFDNQSMNDSRNKVFSNFSKAKCFIKNEYLLDKTGKCPEHYSNLLETTR